MTEEIKHRIETIDLKMQQMEIGSVQHDMYRQIRKELVDKLEQKEVKLHVDAGSTCDGCQ